MQWLVQQGALSLGLFVLLTVEGILLYLFLPQKARKS
jgi:hypothetical protein